jgi:signal transduction histidine kinase
MGVSGGDLIVRIYPDFDGKSLLAEIQDSGPGVLPEMKEQIFNPFVTTKKTGVGLGLAIVSKIVDAHGGTLKLISAAGRGACFQVTLPVAEVKPLAFSP